MKVLGLGSRESKIGSDIMQPSRYYSPISCHRRRLERIVTNRRLPVKSRMTQAPTVMTSYLILDRGRNFKSEFEAARKKSLGWEPGRWEGIHFCGEGAQQDVR